MASNLHVTLKRHNGTDIDSLFPKTTWAQILDKPSTYTPTTHGHAISEITSLQTALDGKAASSHAHVPSSITTNADRILGRIGGGTGGATELTAANIQSFLGLGTLAYSSATIPTNTNQLTNGAGFITSSASISGNAATATKLAAPVNINGVSFDGSASITVYDGSKLSLNGGTLQDDLILAKDGSTEVGSHGIVFQANTLGGDFTRELNIDKTGKLLFGGTEVLLAGSHTHATSDITSGVFLPARLGSGTASSSTFLRGDNTWQTVPSALVSSVNGYTGNVSTEALVATTQAVNSVTYSRTYGGAVLKSSGTQMRVSTGFYAPSASSSGNAISFGTTFAYAPMVVAFCVKSASTTATVVAAKVTAVSTTGCTIISSWVAASSVGYTPAAETYGWIAIGY